MGLVQIQGALDAKGAALEDHTTTFGAFINKQSHLLAHSVKDAVEGTKRI